jgi:phosphoglycolate phosphatase-like HAD superfamily hydrolase
VTSIPFDVYVFDFDGTLVQSAAGKRQAFFAIFPPSCRVSVEKILTREPDGSRHRVIPAMIEDARQSQIPSADRLEAAQLIAAYGSEARQAVLAAPEMEGATTALRRAAQRATCYVASMTPGEELRDYLEGRGWTEFIREGFGYPQTKHEVVAHLVGRHGIAPHRLLVVGDGVSDHEAAARNGAAFHHIRSNADLVTIPGLGETCHA